MEVSISSSADLIFIMRTFNIQITVVRVAHYTYRSTRYLYISFSSLGYLLRVRDDPTSARLAR